MIDIRTALQNVLRAVYGKDVRQSIHDAIFQINENANEAIDLAQIKFGNLVTDPTSPIADPTTGDPFRDGVVYFNVLTGIWWKLSGGAWVKLGTTRGISGNAKISTTGLIDTYRTTFTDGTYFDYSVANGAQGVSVTDLTKVRTIGNVDHYDVNLSDGNTTPNGIDVTNGKDGLSIVDVKLLSQVGNVKNYTFERSDGTNTPNSISVEDGVSSYIHVRYSAQFDGTGMVSIPDSTTDYIGICVTNQSAAPTNPTVYYWTKFVGSNGSGTGDMLKSDFATKYPKTADRAAALFDGANEILASQLMALAIYASNGNAGIVDKAAILVDLVNGKIADSELLANLSDNAGQLEYKGMAIGGKVDLDGASIIENASGQLEVSVDNDTIYIDTANKRIYVKPKFTTGDSTNLSSMNAPTTVAVISSNEAPKTLFNKISTMIKNLRWLLVKYGSADISSLGQGADIGTITGALVDLNSKIGSGGGGFFDYVLPITYDSSLVGQPYAIKQYSSDDSTVSPKSAKEGIIGDETSFTLHCLGKYQVLYGTGYTRNKQLILESDDFNNFLPAQFSFDISRALIPVPISSLDSHIVASSTQGTYEAFRPFETDKPNTYWAASTGRQTGDYIGYAFDSPVILTQVTIDNSGIGTGISAGEWKVYGYNRKLSGIVTTLPAGGVELGTISSPAKGGKETHEINNSTPYYTYVLCCTRSNWLTAPHMGKLQFYGY